MANLLHDLPPIPDSRLGVFCLRCPDHPSRLNKLMPQARKYQVAPDVTPYYHCISRCVRRAFLCGVDHYTGRSFEHRRAWIVERLTLLSEVFAIDICAYAVMSNHFHLVVKIQQQRALSWTVDEVITRWTQLFSPPPLVTRFREGDSLSAAEEKLLAALLAVWRERLSSLSWFMRALNEGIARRANREDECTGRFWEGRFTSQALLDEAALLTAMAYVDLNPIRAGLAATLENADYTAIQARIREHTSLPLATTKATAHATTPRLQPLHNGAEGRDTIPFHYHDYIELLTWTSQQLRPGKRRAFAHQQPPPILLQLGINTQPFIRHMQARTRGRFYCVIGTLRRIQEISTKLSKKFLKGQSYAATLFQTG